MLIEAVTGLLDFIADVFNVDIPSSEGLSDFTDSDGNGTIGPGGNIATGDGGD